MKNKIYSIIICTCMVLSLALGSLSAKGFRQVTLTPQCDEPPAHVCQ